MSQKLRNAIALYMEGIRDGKVKEAIEKYSGDRYTQHSTGVKDGKEGFIEFLNLSFNEILNGKLK
jgi:predicted SnoaL-like aldol condensation-catalyzing enzyme